MIKEELNFDLKRNPRKKRKTCCPYCGNEMKIKVLNSFKYCNVCHEQLPGFAAVNNFNNTDSVKEID